MDFLLKISFGGNGASPWNGDDDDVIDDDEDVEVDVDVDGDDDVEVDVDDGDDEDDEDSAEFGVIGGDGAREPLDQP